MDKKKPKIKLLKKTKINTIVKDEDNKNSTEVWKEKVFIDKDEQLNILSMLYVRRTYKLFKDKVETDKVTIYLCPEEKCVYSLRSILNLNNEIKYEEFEEHNHPIEEVQEITNQLVHLTVADNPHLKPI